MAKKRAGCIIGGVLLAVVAWVGFILGPEAVNAYQAGFFEQQKKQSYEGDSLDNLRRLHVAMMLYHESEGQFPMTAGWMDAIENRLQTNDLKPGEGVKKLHNPNLAPAPDVYGYAMNVAAGGQYREDIAGGDATVLLFESKPTARNAAGDPANDASDPPSPGGNLAVTIGGALKRDGKPVPEMKNP